MQTSVQSISPVSVDEKKFDLEISTESSLEYADLPLFESSHTASEKFTQITVEYADDLEIITGVIAAWFKTAAQSLRETAQKVNFNPYAVHALLMAADEYDVSGMKVIEAKKVFDLYETNALEIIEDAATVISNNIEFINEDNNVNPLVQKITFSLSF